MSHIADCFDLFMHNVGKSCREWNVEVSGDACHRRFYLSAQVSEHATWSSLYYGRIIKAALKSVGECRYPC